MKKAVSVMLSLLVLGATFFTSCSVDSDDGGGENLHLMRALLMRMEISWSL